MEVPNCLDNCVVKINTINPQINFDTNDNKKIQ